MYSCDVCLQIERVISNDGRICERGTVMCYPSFSPEHAFSVQIFVRTSIVVLELAISRSLRHLLACGQWGSR
jgi:hypothetical protein